jgi:hypothetical protein
MAPLRHRAMVHLLFLFIFLEGYMGILIYRGAVAIKDLGERTRIDLLARLGKLAVERISPLVKISQKQTISYGKETN